MIIMEAVMIVKDHKVIKQSGESGDKGLCSIAVGRG